MLGFALRNSELQPQLLVRRAGGWIPELEIRSPRSEVRSVGVEGRRQKAEGGGQEPEVEGQKAEVRDQRSGVGGQQAEGSGEHPTSNIQHPTSNQPRSPTLNPQLSTLHCPVLLIHGERDEVFPVADCKRVAERLRADGTPVEVWILPELGHGFGEETGPVVRALAEYCAAHLPLADYCGSQRSEGRRQKTEDGGQRTEGGGVKLRIEMKFLISLISSVLCQISTAAAFPLDVGSWTLDVGR